MAAPNPAHRPPPPPRTIRELQFDVVDSVLVVARRGVSLAVLAGIRGNLLDATEKCRQCLVLLDGARERLARLLDAEHEAADERGAR